jgi:hypothetical protein
VAGILGCQLLTDEDMSQVSSAVAADDLCPPAIRVELSGDRTIHLIVEAGPAAAGIELINGVVQESITALTVIIALFKELVKFSAEGPFSSLVKDDPFFFRSEISIFLFHIGSPKLFLRSLDQLLADTFQR